MEREVVVVGSCAIWADWMSKAELFCGGGETKTSMLNEWNTEYEYEKHNDGEMYQNKF